MTKKLLLIFENSEIESILDSEVNNESLIIAGDQTIQEKITDLGYACKLINDYSKNSKNEIDKSVEWIKNWPDKPILNGKNFKELLVYDELSIFWFLETRLYLYRIQSLIPLIEQIQNLISLEKPTEIFIKGNNDAYYLIKKKYGDIIQKIKFTSNEKNYNKTSYNSYSGNRLLKLLTLKFLRGLGSYSKKDKATEGPILIITEMSGWRPDYDYKKKKIIHKDFFFHSIIKKLKTSNLPIRIIDFENKPKRLLKSKFLKNERQKAFGVTVESWENYISLEIIKKTIKFNHDLEQLWEKISKSEEFKKSLTYGNIPLYEILKNDIESLLKTFKSYMSMTLIETSKRILDIIKPSLVLMHDEYGTLQLCLIKEASKRKIPTISIQHGVNTETWISYVHNPEHINGKNSDLNFPIPDHLCVWSENAKSNLIKYGNFPPSVPIVTGDPKTDFLPDAIKNFDSNKIKSSIGIPDDKKIILFATQPLANLEEKSLITNTIFKAISKIEKSFLVIKAHPNESDLSYYEKIAKNFEVKNFLILQSHNLYELIFVSRIVIVPFSTVGIEAMRLRKPVIALNMMGLHDDDPLIHSGIPIVVKKEKELIPAIEQCLHTESILQILDREELFAQKELGNLDGLSSEKIVELILKSRKNSAFNL